jgi:hypothetical protein
MFAPVAVRLKRLYSELSVDNQIVFAAALSNKLCGSNAATQAARWCGAIHREFELQAAAFCPLTV